VAVDPDRLVLTCPHRLDCVQVAMANALLTEHMRGGARVDLATSSLDEADHLLRQRRVAPEAVCVIAPKHIKPSCRSILAQVAVGGHRLFSLRPKKNVAGMTWNRVNGHDLATDLFGKLATLGLLV
jgi:hypothetical protein